MFNDGFKYRLRAYMLSQAVISRKEWILDCLFACLIGVCLAYGLFISLSS